MTEQEKNNYILKAQFTLRVLSQLACYYGNILKRAVKHKEVNKCDEITTLQNICENVNDMSTGIPAVSKDLANLSDDKFWNITNNESPLFVDDVIKTVDDWAIAGKSACTPDPQRTARQILAYGPIVYTSFCYAEGAYNPIRRSEELKNSVSPQTLFISCNNVMEPAMKINEIYTSDTNINAPIVHILNPAFSTQASDTKKIEYLMQQTKDMQKIFCSNMDRKLEMIAQQKRQNVRPN